MPPEVIEGWDLKIVQEDRLYRYRKTMDQNELHLDVFGMHSSPWGYIEDRQNPIENCIDIIYDQGNHRWESRVCDRRVNSIPAIIRGPCIDQDLDAIEDLARFLVGLAGEITSSGWDAIKNRSILALGTC